MSKNEYQHLVVFDKQSSHIMMEKLAKRVMKRRQTLGLSLKSCAQKAQLSTRYLIQVEQGKANLSIAKLNQLCFALELRPAELLSEGRRGRIDTLLSSLSQSELNEAFELLSSHFKQNRLKLVALLGVRGAGKSTVGQALAKALSWPMIEVDEEIESRAGLSLNELFAVHGETYYRRLEGEVLQSLKEREQPAVIATGGSIVTHHLHYTLLKKMSYTIYLQASAEEHMGRVIAQGDQRPMKDNPQAMNELKALLKSRQPLYEMANKKMITSHKTINAIVTELKKAIETDLLFTGMDL